jgi:hypothetical protein
VPLRPCATHVDHLDMRTVVGIKAADDGAGAAVVRGGFDRFQQTTQVRIRPADLEGRRRPNGLFELPLVWSRNDKGL